jgi:hypothetical protein
MPKYTNTHGKINLNDYEKVKELTTGKTNKVSLWKHKQDSNLKIVIKIPNGDNSDLVQHNIRSINAFFGEDSAWLIEGEIEGKQGFAMKYYDGISLSSQEENQLVKKKDSPLITISKNGLLFTMLDRNKDNFLKLPTGEFIPIDFDYMIIHDGTQLLPYQKAYLQGRMGFSIRVGACSDEAATQHVLDSYPAAAPYLYEQWGKQYLKTDKYNQSPKVVPTPVIDKQRSPSEKNCLLQQDALKIQNLREKINDAILGKKIITRAKTELPVDDKQSYLGWMSEHATGIRGITRFSHWYHGDRGVNRARDLLETANTPGATYQEILQKLQTVFQESSQHKHSLSRYLVAKFDQKDFAIVEVLSDDNFSEIKTTFEFK